MLKEDFLLRMLQEALRVLSLILTGKKDDGEKKEDIKRCYTKFLEKDKQDFLSMSLEQLTNAFEEDSTESQLMKLEILATLFYSDAVVTSDSQERRQLGIRALYLFEYISKWTHTYSIDREMKIAKLKQSIDLD